VTRWPDPKSAGKRVAAWVRNAVEPRKGTVNSYAAMRVSVAFFDRASKTFTRKADRLSKGLYAETSTSTPKAKKAKKALLEDLG